MHAVNILTDGKDPDSVALDGVPHSAFLKLHDLSGMSTHKFADLMNISMSTLARRARLGKFKHKESTVLLRYAAVYDSAVDLFEGNKQLAIGWLQKPLSPLGNVAPIDMLLTQTDTSCVLDVIGRIKHGIPA